MWLLNLREAWFAALECMWAGPPRLICFLARMCGSEIVKLLQSKHDQWPQSSRRSNDHVLESLEKYDLDNHNKSQAHVINRPPPPVPGLTWRHVFVAAVSFSARISRHKKSVLHPALTNSPTLVWRLPHVDHELHSTSRLCAVLYILSLCSKFMQWSSGEKKSPENKYLCSVIFTPPSRESNVVHCSGIFPLAPSPLHTVHSVLSPPSYWAGPVNSSHWPLEKWDAWLIAIVNPLLDVI